MARIYFMTHPEVQFDWAIPVPQWDLSDVGRARLEKLITQPWIRTLTSVFASPERKSVSAATRIAQVCDVPLCFMPELTEIDRSAAGTLPPEQYSAVTEMFFARPDQSARGWERATDAQRRITGAFERIVKDADTKANVAIVSHGGVGTLLLCQLKSASIRRSEDQPGQGHYFVYNTEEKRVEHGWRRIDDLQA